MMKKRAILFGRNFYFLLNLVDDFCNIKNTLRIQTSVISHFTTYTDKKFFWNIFSRDTKITLSVYVCECRLDSISTLKFPKKTPELIGKCSTAQLMFRSIITWKWDVTYWIVLFLFFLKLLTDWEDYYSTVGYSLYFVGHKNIRKKKLKNQ